MNDVVDKIHEILEQWGITHRFKFENLEEANSLLVALEQPDIDFINCDPKDDSISIIYKDDNRNHASSVN